MEQAKIIISTLRNETMTVKELTHALIVGSGRVDGVQNGRQAEVADGGVGDGRERGLETDNRRGSGHCYWRVDRDAADILEHLRDLNIEL